MHSPFSCLAGIDGGNSKLDALNDGLRGLKVLVVDDNENSADATAILLTLYGCEVRVEYDARRVVEVVRHFKPALVLLDLEMPGVDGYEACRLIRAEQGDDVFVAALTGWSRDVDRQRSADAGCNVHLVKPLEVENLVEVAAMAAHR